MKGLYLLLSNNKTLESAFQKDPPDGAAVLPPYKRPIRGLEYESGNKFSVLWFWGQSYQRHLYH